MIVYRKHSLTAGRIVEGLAFVVTADDNKLHTLNETGSEVWALAASGVTVDEAAEALVKLFQVDLPTARADVLSCLESFVERGILVAQEEP
tara:strand:- start:29904 stop:30176 length:273 start_codon:yes stop_codon:yes gene_type:complete